MRHKAWGAGTVTRIDGGSIYVSIGGKERMFQFPGAFEQEFLSLLGACMSDNAINIPGNVSSDMQKESSKPLFTLQRGATRREVNAVEARHFVQGILSRSINLATLIGSGASTPAIPLMGETFRNLRADLKLNDPDLSILLESRITKIACRDNEDPAKYSNIENLLSWLSQRIEGSLDSADDDKRVSDAVRKAFLESVDIKYSAEHSDVLDSYRKFVQGLGVSRQILARGGQAAFDVVNLFTTNYDLFHEMALESSGYAYVDGFSNGLIPTFNPREYHRRPIDLDERFRDHYEPVNPFFRLYKMHGSINWRIYDGNVVRIPRFPDITDEYQGDRQLIAPMTSKYALTQGSPYSDMFREFVNALAVPNTVLLTCGFSFADSHISNLISQALARPDFTLLAFIGNPAEADVGSPTRVFYDKAGGANTYFVYPSERELNRKRPLYFSEFADFIGPEITFGDDVASGSLGLGDKND